MSAVSTHRDGGIARLMLNRPDAGNAIDMALADALALAADDVAADPAVRCVVLTGAGRMFCVGGDIGGFAAAGDDAPGFLHALAARMHPTLAEQLDREAAAIAAAAGRPEAREGIAAFLACRKPDVTGA